MTHGVGRRSDGCSWFGQIRLAVARLRDPGGCWSGLVRPLGRGEEVALGSRRSGPAPTSPAEHEGKPDGYHGAQDGPATYTQ